MGLDMYLERKTYVKNWDHTEKENRTEIIIKGKKANNINSEKVSEIVEEVAYWRKANQIHKWFVDHCAGGEDTNGRDHVVTREQLQELVDTCKKVISHSGLMDGKIENGKKGTPNGWEPIMQDGKLIVESSLAQELLPTESGFFFGSTGYDQYYIEDLQSTIDNLTIEEIAKHVGKAVVDRLNLPGNSWRPNQEANSLSTLVREKVADMIAKQELEKYNASKLA